MLLLPDPDTAFVDPACKIPTLSIICDVVPPGSMERYTRDPRYVAKKAEAFLTDQRHRHHRLLRPRGRVLHLQLDPLRPGRSRSGFYEIDSEEGIWNSVAQRQRPNLGYRPRYKEGYFPVPPMDKLQDLRSEIVLELEKAGIKIEVHHHEVGTAGQTEIDMRFGTLVKMADQVLKYKYIVKNVCYRNGYTATFMPKPLFGDNGSGMHTHQSLWNGDEPLFYDKDGYALLSEMCRHYIGGLLKHAPAILAFAAPTTNSYRRLVPGYEAPINLVYSQRNRSACVRIPTYSSSPKARRLEFRAPDPSCNPYLAFSAMLMAGLDGVINKIEPPAPGRRGPVRAGGQRERRRWPDHREHARQPGRGARGARSRPRLPAQGRRLHPRPDRGVDQLQARARARAGRPPPAPVRVSPLLRHLASSGPARARFRVQNSRRGARTEGLEHLLTVMLTVM